MKKLLPILLFAAALGVRGTEIDFTAGAEKLDSFRKRMRNIEILPAGKDGGIIAAEPGKYAYFQLPNPPKFAAETGSIEVTIAPIAEMSFYKDAKKIESMTLLEIVWQNKTQWTIGAVMAPTYQLLQLSVAGKTTSLNIGKWKKGEAHTLAIRWADGKVMVSADGKLLLEVPKPEALAEPIIVSVCGYNNTAFCIQKVNMKDR